MQTENIRKVSRRKKVDSDRNIKCTLHFFEVERSNKIEDFNIKKIEFL